MNQIVYRFVFGLWWLLSLLPWRLHYVLSDVVLYPMLRHVLRYRRRIVRQNLAASFPEMSVAELRQIEGRFYHWLCDYFVELIKQATMTPADIRRHMEFVGVDECVARFEASGQPLCVIYLAHYANWEWFTAFASLVPEHHTAAQIYHPLHNKAMDRILLRNRSICGAESVPMKSTLRAVLTAKREGRPMYLGFIADQSPKANALHHWMEWLHQDTPVITGGETIGERVGAVYYYIDVERIRRGYYRATLRRLDAPASAPAQASSPLETDGAEPYPMTEAYMRAVEQSIARDPALWLWTHKRWKHRRS